MRRWSISSSGMEKWIREDGMNMDDGKHAIVLNEEYDIDLLAVDAPRCLLRKLSKRQNL
jgi:hypothetical protein